MLNHWIWIWIWIHIIEFIDPANFLIQLLKYNSGCHTTDSLLHVVSNFIKISTYLCKGVFQGHQTNNFYSTVGAVRDVIST